MSAHDAARVSVHVAVSPEDAFAVFTDEIELWWETGPAYRIAGRQPGKLALTPGLGGRLFETVQLPSGERTFETGRVLVWEPPSRLVLEWRGVNFAPHETTRVEVTFTALGEGTMVVVTHSGWSAIPDGHPARHGKVGGAFIREIGMWWGGLATSLREHVARRGA